MISRQFGETFDTSGNIKWTVPGSYLPQIATADGGVIATSGNGAVTFDANGNATGQMASLPTQSWTGNAYQIGSIEQVLSSVINGAGSFWPFAGGNVSVNSTAVIEQTLYIRNFAPWIAFGPDPLAYVPPYVPVTNPCLLYCFQGDNRTFTTSLSQGVTSRITGVVKLLLPGTVAIVYKVYSDPSIAIYRTFPFNTATGKPKMDNIFPGSGEAQLHLSGNNPLVPGSPDIDTHLNMTGTVTAGQACYTGNLYGDAFPNSEVFIINSHGQATTLLNFTTAYDQNIGPDLLVGDHNFDMGSFSNVCMSK